MNAMNRSVVKEQYKTASNLNTRMSIHGKCSVNKQGFGNWLVSNYKIKSGAKILEIGCGTGAMWTKQKNLLDIISAIVLTDFSEGMLQSAKELLGNHPHISYEVVDIQNIPFNDNSFDIVIANMMLYHVPDIHRGLSEVKRVLKPDGIFYCATYGEYGITEYLARMLKNYGVDDKLNKRFTLQNGERILREHFADVYRLDYEDALEVTDVNDMLEYISSLTSMSNINTIPREELKQILESNMTGGILRIPKEYGMFTCEN